jgi:hypothetical protein
MSNVNNTEPQEAPVVESVVFIDLGFKTRVIPVGKDKLHVENGRVTATRPAHIKALDKMYGMKREKS